MLFIPPADALSRAIAGERRRTVTPLFAVNRRWQLASNAELWRTLPPVPTTTDARVWHDSSMLTTSAYACEHYGEAEAASTRAKNGWKTRRANGNGNGNGH